MVFYDESDIFLLTKGAQFFLCHPRPSVRTDLGFKLLCVVGHGLEDMSLLIYHHAQLLMPMELYLKQVLSKPHVGLQAKCVLYATGCGIVLDTLPPFLFPALL